MENIVVNTVALLNAESTAKITKTMKELSEISKNTRALRFPPHFSIRNSFEISKENFSNLKSDIVQYLQQSRFPNDFIANEITYTPWNAVFLEIAVSESLQKLHEAVMNTSYKYKTPWVEPELLLEKSFDEKQKYYISKYGYHLAFEYFRPHITLAGGKIEEERMPIVRSYKYSVPVKGKIESVAFFRRLDDLNWELYYKIPI